MELNKLIEILAKQKQNLKSLLKIVKEKQTVLVENKLEKLPGIMRLEENKLLEIQLTEENRLKIMQQLFTEYKIESERFKLEILTSELKNKIPANVLEKIKNMEREIKEVITETTKTNQQNLLLVQQSSQIISATVKAVIDSSKRSIVDRKG